MKPTESEAETKKAPVEDEEVELVSDLYDAEAKGVTATENKTKVSGERAPKQTAEGSKATSITISRDAFKVESVDDTQYDNYGYVLYPKTDMTADEIKQIVRELQEKLKNVPDGEYFYVSPLKTRDGKWEIKVTANYPSVVLSESALFDEVTSAEAKGGRMYSAPDTDIITPEQDRAYLDAVNRGDVETAQRMVDEAAKKAGYYSPLLYHGTKMFGFTKVKTSGVEKGMEWSPFFAANKEDISASYVPYGKVRDISSTMDEDAIEDARETAIDERKENITDLVYDFRDLIDRHISPWVFGQTDNSYLESLVEEANPEAGHGDGVYDVLTEIVYDSFYSYQDELGEYEEADDWLDNSPEGKEIISKILEIEGEKSALHRLESGEELGGIYQLYANLDNMYVVDGKGAAWNELRPKGLPKLERYGIKDAPYRTRDVAEWARENGYDGVIFKNIRDNGAYGRTPAGDVYAFFRPESQVKSADTITYDDNGDIIPLSERFNSENNDIRYSSADTDILLPELDSPSVSHSITTLESAKDTSGGRLYNYKAMEADEEEYRKMINQETGEIIEQKPLTPKFNLDEITEIMDDAIAQYPTVSKHQDAATEVVTKLFVEGKVRGDMSAEEIYSAVEKAVREETDNTTVYNILESVKDLDGRMYSAEDTDIILPSEEIEALNLENMRLKAENEALKEQFQKTKIKKPESKDLERVLNKITKNFGLSEEDAKRIRHRLREEYYQPRLNPTNDGRFKTLKGVMSKWQLEQNLESICKEIIESADILPESTYVTEAIAEAKEFLKDKSFIKATDSEVNELYDTLVSKFPELFSADKNMRTRAKRHRIEEIVSLPTLESTYVTITDNAAIELQNLIMSSLIHPELTYADKVDQRIRDIMNKNMERSSFYRQIIEHETYEAINAQMDDAHKRAMIIKMATRLGKMLNRPTKKNHIPEELREPVAEALSRVNFGDKHATLIALHDSFKKVAKAADELGDVVSADRAEVATDSINSAAESIEEFEAQYKDAVKALAEYYNELKTLVPESVFEKMEPSQKRTIARALVTLEDVAKYGDSKDTKAVEFIKRRLNLTTARVMENANKVMEGFATSDELKYLESRTKTILENHKAYDEMSAEAISNYLKGKEKVTLKDLKGEALEYVYRAVLTINRIVTQENNLLVEKTKARRDEFAKAAFAELASQRKNFGRKLIYDTQTGGIAVDQMEPSTVFALFGDTFSKLFLNIERGVDTQTRINADYSDYMRKLLDKYAYNKKMLNEDIKTFELESGEKLKLSVGEIMSIYLTARQTDGRYHLVNGGIKITPHEELKNHKGVAEKLDALKNPPSKHYRLTELDLDKILASLSKENVEFAESISDYLSKDLANELNEVSMRLYGYKMFTNPKYFGLKVSSDTTRNDVEAKNPGNKGAANPTLRSIGATQARKEKAGNRLNIRDVFSMTDDHVSTMSAWAAYVEPLTDFESVYNYKVDNADTVKSKLEDVFGENAVAYIANFINRVNGAKNGTGEDLDDLYRKFIGATRSAKTAANLSVTAKQPTSFFRAAQYLPAKAIAKHMLPIHKNKGYTERMLKYSGLARMKELGYSDLSFGRRVGDTYDTSQNSWLEKLNDFAASGSAKADRKTWSAIWAACEDVTRSNPAYANVDDATFYNEVNRLFNRVIMDTQVVRTSFTTPPAILSESFINKTVYAFKNEPYKQLNMLYRSAVRFEKARKTKDKAQIASAAKDFAKGIVGIVISSAITNAITVAAALIRGWDDLDYVTDEDGERIGWFKYILRKYAETSWWDAVSLVPLVGDIASGMAQGYGGVFEGETTVLEDAFRALGRAIKKANDEDSTEGERRTASGQIALKSAQLISNLTGFPLHNILRDIRATLTAVFRMLDIESHEYKVLTLTGNPSSAYYKQYIGAMLVEAINNKDNESFKGFNDVEYIKEDLKNVYKWSEESIQNLIDKFAVNADGVEKILAEMRDGKSIHSYNFSKYGTDAMGLAEVLEAEIKEDLKENKEDSIFYDPNLAQKQEAYYYPDMTDSAKSTIDTLVRNRGALGAEFALCASGEQLYENAVKAHDNGVSYDHYLEAYLRMKAVESDKDYLGEAIENTSSEKKIAIIKAITTDEKERRAMYKAFNVGATAQNNAILDDAIDAKIKGDTAAYDAAIKRYIDNNKGANTKSATAEYEKRIADIRKDLAKLSYDDPTEYEKQLEYYRSGSVKKYFSADKMSDSKKEWLDSYTDSLARKLKKYEDDAKKTELIYAEAAKYGIKEKELKKRADKLK